MSSFNNYIKDEKINIEPIVEETLDRIDIGGRNLAIYSTADCTNCKKNGDYGFVQTTADTDTTFDLKVLPYLNDTYSGYSLVRTDIVNVGVYKFNAMLTTDCDRINVGANGAKADTLSIFYLKETIPSGTELVISLEITNITQGSFSWKNVMIAKGTKAIDWIPAPEDIDNRMDNLQKQIDGEISNWFLEGTPANNYYPASEWTDNTLKERHIGDTYTNMLPSVVNFNDVDANGNPLWIEEGFLYMGSTYYGYSFEEQRYIHANGRCRTKSIMELPDVATTFTYPENVQAIVSLYDADKKYVANHNWDLDSPATIPAKSTSYKYFSIGFANDDYSIRLTRADLKGISCDTTFICPEAGLSWRWCNFDDTDNSTWHWHKIADSDAVKALQEATKAQQLVNTAQSTANTAQSTANTALTKINNLEIGGRNLVLNSNFTLSAETETRQLMHPITYSFDNDLQQLSGKTVTLSMDIELVDALGGTTSTFKRLVFEPAIYFKDGSKQNLSLAQSISTVAVTNFAGRISKTFTVDDKEIDYIDQKYVYIQGLLSGKASISNPKLEFGNIATDWTPAPEDLMPNIAGSTGNLIYNDGTKWTTVITPSTDVCNILTIGGGTGSPTWFTGPSAGAGGSILTAGGGTGLSWIAGPSNYNSSAILTAGGGTGVRWDYGPSAGSNISLLTGGGGTGSMRWMYGPSSESLMTIGGSSINYIQTPSSSSSAQVLVGGGGTGVRWASVENMRGQKGDTGATGATGPRGNTGVAGSQYIKTTEAVGSFMTPGNTLASKYGFRIGDFTVTSDRMLLSCVSVTGSSFATITSLSGTTGATGLRGVTGIQGRTGVQGVTGKQGATGLRGATGLSTIPVGTIQMFAGSTIPTGWLLCDGKYIPTSSTSGNTVVSGYEAYQDLATVLNGTYGRKQSPSGSFTSVTNTTLTSGYGVALPNFLAKIPVGATGTGTYKLGGTTLRGATGSGTAITYLGINFIIKY